MLSILFTIATHKPKRKRRKKENKKLFIIRKKIF